MAYKSLTDRVAEATAKTDSRAAATNYPAKQKPQNFGMTMPQAIRALRKLKRK